MKKAIAELIRLLSSLLSTSSNKRRDHTEDREVPLDPSGMIMIACVGDVADPSKLPIPTDTIVCEGGSGAEKLAGCGHTAQQTLRFNAYGDVVLGADWHCCAECGVAELKKVVIRCALCGNPIFPGSPVAIYNAKAKGIRDEAYLFQDGALTLGCMLWDCCPSGGLYAGHWTGKEFRPLDFESADEGGSSPVDESNASE